MHDGLELGWGSLLNVVRLTFDNARRVGIGVGQPVECSLLQGECVRTGLSDLDRVVGIYRRLATR